VKRLVDRFDLGRKVFLSGDYKEEQLRPEFLAPFFTALGWDMDNKQGLSETFKQVIRPASWLPAEVEESPRVRTDGVAEAHEFGRLAIAAGVAAVLLKLRRCTTP
jgi:hypothetical protein